MNTLLNAVEAALTERRFGVEVYVEEDGKFKTASAVLNEDGHSFFVGGEFVSKSKFLETVQSFGTEYELDYQDGYANFSVGDFGKIVL